METQTQPKELEWKYQDVTFYIRAKAGPRDKFELSMLYGINDEGEVIIPKAESWLTMIRLFVNRWEGVTKEGKSVPFSIKALGELPIDYEYDIISHLGTFIINSVGIVAKPEEAVKKKD